MNHVCDWCGDYIEGLIWDLEVHSKPYEICRQCKGRIEERLERDK
jgi:hypothetical protein